jgi:AcrR family transcriptional regulator
MASGSVDWTAAGPAQDEAARNEAAQDEAAGAEGLRMRKKRLLRQRLSDTATAMFVERGFDAVKVVDVAAACDVSEKTVYNYFPTKESLVLDRWDATMAALRRGLADPATDPVEVVRGILASELAALTGWLEGQHDRAAAVASVVRFGELLDATPALRAHQHEAIGQLTTVATRLLAERSGVSPDDPEPQITAIALLGLWQVHFRALRKYLYGTCAPAQLNQAVTADVDRAARLIAGGLSKPRSS